MPAGLTSMPSPRILVTMSSTRSHWRLPTWEGPRQAAPMQKRVLPASRARRAACSSAGTACQFVSRPAWSCSSQAGVSQAGQPRAPPYSSAYVTLPVGQHAAFCLLEACRWEPTSSHWCWQHPAPLGPASSLTQTANRQKQALTGSVQQHCCVENEYGRAPSKQAATTEPGG